MTIEISVEQFHHLLYLSLLEEMACRAEIAKTQRWLKGHAHKQFRPYTPRTVQRLRKKIAAYQAKQVTMRQLHECLSRQMPQMPIILSPVKAH